MKRGPHKRENKLLSKKGLIETIAESFRKIEKTEESKKKKKGIITIFDCLMSAFAMFNLKYVSLLSFDDAVNEKALCKNLETLFEIKNIPSDTYMREVLDEIDPKSIRNSFLEVFKKLQRGRFLEQYKFLDGYLVAGDGTGVFESNKVHCQNCCEKIKKGTSTYYHQILAGAIVHPNKSQVIPLCPEPIYKQDGASKNDCEVNAAKRFLADLKREHPHLPVTITLDALFATGPFIRELQKHNYDYIIVAKPGNNTALFNRLKKIKLNTTTIKVEKNKYKFRYINQIPLNNTKNAQLVNYYECKFTEINGTKTVTKTFSWITSHTITKLNLLELMRGGRAKWKIENETFNTLKNQGYQFEHNFGHGKKNLHTIFALLMMLAFLTDQTQEATDGLFKVALEKKGSRRALWERLRGFFFEYILDSWEQVYNALAFGHKNAKLNPNTS